MIIRLRPAVLASVLTLCSAVSACPLCRSETGERVRAGIFNAEIGYNLFATLIPFPIFLGIIAWMHFGVPRAKSPSRSASPRGAEDPA